MGRGGRRIALAIAGLAGALSVQAQAPAESIDRWLVAGRSAEARGERFTALRAFGEARRVDPAHPEAAQAISRLLSALGGHHGAAAALDPPSFAVRAGMAAEQVRWGASLPPVSPARRYEGTDAAIASLEALVAQGVAKGEQDALVPVRGDLAVALRDRRRWKDVLELVAAMRADGAPIRAYVRRAEADALLALRRPEEARTAYADVLAADAGDRDALVGRFYAEVECEDFEAAFRTADAVPGFDGQVLAAQARHYAGLDAQAWARLSPLVASAPALGYVHAAASSVASARGWPRFAHEEIAIASTLAPDDAGVASSLAASHLRRRDYAQARARAASLAIAYPEDDAVARLARDLADHDRAAWQVDMRGRKEAGGAAAAPGPGIEMAVRAWSSPLAESWRLLAVLERATAKPPEGRAQRNRGGAGAEWRLPDATFEAMGWANGGTLPRSGASVAANFAPSDGWTLGADAERYSRDTPLRALLYGITADTAGVSAGYAWNESRSAFVSWRHGDFSDGNRRGQWRLAWAERIVDDLRGQVTLRPEYYESRNTRPGAPYFNPSRDRSVGLGVDADALLSRRYESSWRHRAGVRLSRYRQEGYTDGWTGGASYEQAWSPQARLEIRYGLDWGRARYDGANERVLQAFLTVSGRF